MYFLVLHGDIAIFLPFDSLALKDMMRVLHVSNILSGVLKRDCSCFILIFVINQSNLYSNLLPSTMSFGIFK